MSARGIASLWRGEISLAKLFWEYVIAWGTLLNVLFTGAALIALLQRAADWIPLALHFAPTPLNAFLVVATWRAAAREHQSPLANIARIGAVLWFLAMLAI